MSFAYELMYFLGIHPWDRGENEIDSHLRDVVSALTIKPGSRALDLGCGMGRNSLFLARTGFTVTGVDSVERALRVARERARVASISIDFTNGDVTRLEKSGVKGPFDFLLDSGCFHSMSDEERDRYGQSLAAVSAPGAEFLIMAFGRKTGRTMGPRGANTSDVEASLAAHFELISQTPESDVPEFIRRNFESCMWYMLRRKKDL